MDLQSFHLFFSGIGSVASVENPLYIFHPGKKKMEFRFLFILDRNVLLSPLVQ